MKLTDRLSREKSVEPYFFAHFLNRRAQQTFDHQDIGGLGLLLFVAISGVGGDRTRMNWIPDSGIIDTRKDTNIF